MRKLGLVMSVLAAVLLVCVAVRHYRAITAAAVEIPYMDEWENFGGEAFPETLDARYLLLRHNEHQIAPTRVMTTVLYRLDGWSLVRYTKLSYLLFLSLVAFWCALAVRRVEKPLLWLPLLATVFVLSPRNAENLLWGNQSQFHFSMIFMLAGAAALFAKEQRRWQVALGSLLLAVAVFSLASSVASVLAVVAAYALFAVKTRRPFHLAACVLPLAAIALSLGTLEHHAGHPAYAMPWTAAFWRFFLNLASHGFGVQEEKSLWGIVWLLAAAVPVALLVPRAWREKVTTAAAPSWGLAAAALGVTAAMAAITIGRGNGDLTMAKSSRYFEIGAMLIPLAALAWILAFEKKPRCQVIAGALLFAGLAVSFRDDWNFKEIYAGHQAPRRAGRDCAERYFRDGGDGRCPTLYPAPLAAHFEKARAMDAFFVRDILATPRP